MNRFLNQQYFDEQLSRQLASGVDSRPQSAVRDSKGQILFQLQTGGMMSPVKTELRTGSALMRFASGAIAPDIAMAGGWWIEQASFDRILRFSQVHDVPLILAARILCGVPPEWSDMRQLVRVRLRHELLAWRGLANSVIVPYPAGGPAVKLLHQNSLSERRLPQLFIPGLDRMPIMEVFQFERVDRFNEMDSKRGWLYL